MKKQNEVADIVSAHLVLLPNKQRALLEMLQQYSRLELVDLASLLTLPQEELQNVLKGDAYFNKTDAKKLAEYFCIFCGE